MIDDLLHTVAVREKGAAVIIGRDRELARAGNLLTAGRGVVVVGEAGVGKTTLLEHALAEVRATGRRTLAARCFRSLAHAHVAPLQQAFDGPVPVGDPAWTAQWVISHLGARVLNLDDAQWADPLTLDVVEQLVGRAVLAVTVRTGDPAAADVLQRLAGLERIDLAPLESGDAELLAVRAHPALLPADAARLAHRCGGNPLLIEQLGTDPEVNSSLRHTVVRRLRRMGQDPWIGFGVLARAGEPVPADWLPGLDDLRAGGLVVDDPSGLVRPWHPLLADVVRAHLDDDPAARDTVDRLLADRAERDGRQALAAAAFAACGQRAAALRNAVEAAQASDRPGERAALLHLAARCADGDRAVELAIVAVTELVQVADYEAAATLLDQLPHQETAGWYSLVGRIRWQTGDAERALAAYDAGLALAKPGTHEDVVLRCEHARALALSGGDPATALREAHGAYEASVATGRERARALAILGTVENFAADSADSARHLAEALVLAEHDPDADLQVFFSAANNVVAALEGIGDVDGAVASAESSARRADALHLRGWANQLRAMGLNARLHHGDYRPIVADAPGMLAEHLNRRTRDQLEVTLGLALVDLGRLDALEDRIGRALDASADDHLGRGNLLWVWSEARLWAGDPAGALARAEESLGLLTDNLALFPLVTIAHAQLRLERPVEHHDVPDVPMHIVEAAPVELAALAARAAGDPATAGLFGEAAALWRGRHRRGELRCRWMAADSAADAELARAELLELETLLEAEGWLPLLGQVRRSLRARGVRRGSARGRAGEVTLREREVLDLVAQGLGTEAIAARLGLSPATVAAQIASARARLGAATRWQAARES